MTSPICHAINPRHPALWRALACLVSLLFVLNPIQVARADATMVRVNIFGDGDPSNGIEDDRRQIMGGRHSAKDLADQALNAGTISCDGKVRGTAMVVDSRLVAPELKGVILATSAHVVYDLSKRKLFKRCQFHFLALDGISSYRSKINLKLSLLGSFDPASAFDAPEFGQGDWAFLYVPRSWESYRPEEAIELAVFSSLYSETAGQRKPETRLVAYDAALRIMSSSNNCMVVESGVDDLGGGLWKGQLLDDCDSSGGASGGGIVAVLDQRHFLVGIRSGSHWSEDVYPQEAYPGGPPDGSKWERRSNTNFGRAIDIEIMREFRRFARKLVQQESAL